MEWEAKSKTVAAECNKSTKEVLMKELLDIDKDLDSSALSAMPKGQVVQIKAAKMLDTLKEEETATLAQWQHTMKNKLAQNMVVCLDGDETAVQLSIKDALVSGFQSGWPQPISGAGQTQWYTPMLCADATVQMLKEWNPLNLCVSDIPGRDMCVDGIYKHGTSATKPRLYAKPKEHPTLKLSFVGVVGCGTAEGKSMSGPFVPMGASTLKLGGKDFTGWYFVQPHPLFGRADSLICSVAWAVKVVKDPEAATMTIVEEPFDVAVTDGEGPGASGVVHLKRYCLKWVRKVVEGDGPGMVELTRARFPHEVQRDVQAEQDAVAKKSVRKRQRCADDEDESVVPYYILLYISISTDE